MLAFDVAMPLTLFLVVLAAVFLVKRVEGKLKSTLEERELRIRDVVPLVALIVVAVYIVVFVPAVALVAFFMFSYASLLFMFSYFFSDLSKKREIMFILMLLVASLIVGIVTILGLLADGSSYYWGFVALGVAFFALGALVVETRTKRLGAKWYVAVLPSALFIIIFFVFSPTSLWIPFLFDTFGIVFAVLITLYLSSLFTWKTTFVFAALLTAVDFVLVFIIPIMEPAATHIVSLGLPVLIVMPIVPPIFTNSSFLWGLSPIWLGLGDFFFAGTLATQTYKKFDRKTAVISAVTMSVAFGVFELILLNTKFNAFPGTLMIILGWAPVVAWKMISERKSKISANVKN